MHKLDFVGKTVVCPLFSRAWEKPWSVPYFACPLFCSPFPNRVNRGLSPILLFCISVYTLMHDLIPSNSYLKICNSSSG